MRSTGQVLATADTFGLAYFKALESAGTPLPTQGTVLITVTDEDKASILEPARIFQELEFNLMATRGTRSVLTENGIESQAVRKLGFGRPDLVDEIKNGHVQMVINTPTGDQGQIDDSLIRKAAIQSRIANITTPASALAAAKGIAARRSGVSR
jgi:carbamoyl-phosphate synthase large subunit